MNTVLRLVLVCLVIHATTLVPAHSSDADIHPIAQSLIDAALGGDTAQVERLLAQGADVNASDAGGKTPLMMARTAEVTRLLVSHGAHINVKDRSGMTPLIWACLAPFEWGVQVPSHLASGNWMVANYLVLHGADVNQPGARGVTPLMWALNVDDSTLAEFLLQHGAKVDARDDGGDTPLDYFLRNWQPNNFDPKVTPPVVLLLLERAADVNTTDKLGMTPLMWAICDGDLGAMRVLLAHGARPNIRVTPGDPPYIKVRQTPLLLVISSGFGHIETYHQAGQAITLLISYGADPKVTDADGKTALMSAKIRGPQEAVTALLQAGVKR